MMTEQRAATYPAVTHIPDVVARHQDQERWSEVLFRDGRNRMVLISAPPGTPPDPHLHPDFNEWWIVMAGEISWQIGEYEPVVAREGDIVIAHCGARHDIQPRGNVQTMRLGVTSYDSNHDLKGVAPSRLVPLHRDLVPPNLVHTPLQWMLDRHGTSGAWSEEVVLDQRNRANMIHQLPGESNRPHKHPDFDEWWAILKGELVWQIGDDAPVHVRQGDLVFAPAGERHAIRTVGEESSVRLAVTIPGPRHVYEG